MTNSEPRAAALEILVSSLFDYAGMFPPASLSFEQTLLSCAKLPSQLHRPYILASDLVLGLEYLSKLEPGCLAQAGFDSSRALRICALGSSLKNRQELISDQRLEELRGVQSFNNDVARDGFALAVASYEFKLEHPLQGDWHAVQVALRNIKSFLSDEQLRICVEPDLSGDNWEDSLQNCTHLLSDLNLHSRGPVLVLKVRGSGPTAINNHKLLRVINRAVQLQLNLKATAGLHHPIIEKERYKNELGFLGLSTALYLKRALGAEFPDMEALNCLFAADLDAFQLGAEGLGWNGFLVDLPQLRDLKHSFPFSIGSCSLHEPDQDLKRLLKF